MWIFLKIVISPTINARLPLIVPWHLCQKTSWLCLQFANKLWLQKYHIHKCCHYLSQKDQSHLVSLLLFFPCTTGFYFKRWPYLLLHLNPVSYMMYMKCSWSVCQLILSLSHGNTWLARGGAKFIFIKRMWGIVCRCDLFPFLIESEGICLHYRCVFFKSFETNIVLSVDLHFGQLPGIILSLWRWKPKIFQTFAL